MHRRTRISLLLLLGILLVASGWAPSAKPAARPQVIRLLWVQTSTHVTGERSSWTGRLKNVTRQFGKPAGAKVGSELGFSDGSEVSGAVTLPGGVLEFSGPLKLRGKPELRLTITKGAGAFAGLTGTYTRPAGTRAILVLTLRHTEAKKPKRHA